MTKKQNIVLIGLFLAMIFGFSGVSLLTPSREFSEKENRTLQQLPALHLSDVLDGTFATKYEKYLSDQFFGRDTWIALKTAADRAVGKQESNGIYFAKDGYLIEAHKEDFTGKTPGANLQTVADFISNWSTQYSPEHLKVCLVPNAVDIYQEKLPAFAENTQEEEYLRMMRRIIPEEYLLDVENLLLQNKEEQLYYRTDHHWTTPAARMVYEEWAKEAGFSIVPIEEYERVTLTEEFYGTVDAKVGTRVEPDTIEAYLPLEPVSYKLRYTEDDIRETLYDESYLEGRDKYGVFFGGNQPMIRARTEADSGKKLLILKDSYANCFLSFALQDFGSIDIIDLRYFNENLNDYMLTEGYTDVLLLYNLAGFATDTSISKLALASGREAS